MNDVADAVAAWGLPTAHRLPTRPLDDEQFASLLATCTRDRLLGLLGGAARSGDLPVTADQRRSVEELWVGWLAHGLRMERLAEAVVGALREAGIGAVVVKGVATAHTLYDEPSMRVYGDVDVLVEPHRLHAAGDVVTSALGGTRSLPELRPGFDDRFARELVIEVGDAEVDLHRTLVNGAYGVWTDAAACVAAADSIVVAGRPLPVLGPADRLLHTAYASALSDWPPRRMAIRDLAQAVLREEVPADLVVERARAWRGEAVLAQAVRQAWRRLRLTATSPLQEWAERHVSSLRDRILLRASRGRARGYTSQLTALVALPGVRSRAAFVWALAFPSRAFREARGLGRLGLLGAAIRRARRG